MIRLVHVPGNGVEVDREGKRGGRGVYLCPVRECWRIGVEGKRIDYALRVSLTRENREKLLTFGESLDKRD